MAITPIHQIQGDGLLSPLAGRNVRTRGVVTGATRKGFFIQDPDGQRGGGASTGIFVFQRQHRPARGAFVEVRGKVLDYVADPGDHPTTQLEPGDVHVLDDRGRHVEPIWLGAEHVELPTAELVAFLNSIEGMLVGIEKGATFLAPSNPFGDYVVLPRDASAPRTRHGGVRIDPARPERWYPSLRFLDYSRAPRVHVGARLERPVLGPLNYRSAAFQIAAIDPPRASNPQIELESTSLRSAEDAFTILTLNGFNLDAKIEDPSRVNDPGRDVDDDLGDGRFDMLAQAIVEQAGSPDVIAFQEMQDDDGAEISKQVSASQNYAILRDRIVAAGGPRYRWADVAPVEQDDGGQPGGNIRNAFLYDPERMEVVPDSLQRLGAGAPEFAGSRKPLLALFRHVNSGRKLVVVNVHLASKRHQHGIFAVEDPGHDPRESVRIEQAEAIRAALDALDDGLDYYVTGDFNDYEFSRTVKTIVGDSGLNLVESVPEDGRYDYNHRGVCQVLMHGIVRRRQAERVAYEILHGNELLGTKPGRMGDRPTDHAYVIARFSA